MAMVRISNTCFHACYIKERNLVNSYIYICVSLIVDDAEFGYRTEIIFTPVAYLCLVNLMFKELNKKVNTIAGHCNALF